MASTNTAALREASPYNAAITREQFLFYEMRTTVNNVDPIYNVEGEVRYVPYSTIYLDCFATDNGDGTTTIHYLGSSIGVLINDGFVTQEMMDTTIMM